MSADHAKFADTAERLIEKHGRSVTVIRENRTAGDSDNPQWGPGAGSPTEATVTAVFRALRVNEREQLPPTAQKMAVIPANDDGGNDLHLFDRIEDGSQNWRIVGSVVSEPGETRIVYRLGVEALR